MVVPVRVYISIFYAIRKIYGNEKKPEVYYKSRKFNEVNFYGKTLLKKLWYYGNVRVLLRNSGHIPDGHFPDGHIPGWTIPRPDISPTGHFPDRTLPRLDTSPTGHFPDRTLPRPDTSPTGHFPDRTLPRPDTSPTLHFPKNILELTILINGHFSFCFV